MTFQTTIFTFLLIPAIKEALQKQKFNKAEIETVISGLKLVRGGSFFKWKSSYWKQTSGCALGDVDSCDYTDLAMAGLLSTMLPAAEAALLLNLQWFKIYRDDGLCVLFAHPSEAIHLQQFFNNFSSDIQWIIPDCPECSQPLVTCPHNDSVDFLDSKITWSQDNNEHWQFCMSESSKSTDAHAYIAPSSCTAPHLNSEGTSVAKTVGMRLRSLHTKDADLLLSLNNYAGYLVARGYQEQPVKYHLAAMANRDRSGVLRGLYKKNPQVCVPLVTNLHPTIVMASSTMKKTVAAASKKDPLINVFLPQSSLLVSYRRLPNLSRLLCCPDQNKYKNPTATGEKGGYTDTGCHCQVCKASNFGNFISPPSLPGYKLPIRGPVSCK